jgi:hypothetical protein
MAKEHQLKKVLRIGIIQDGKIVQERLIKAGEPVSVGESAKNTFVFPATRLPSAEFLLFGATNDGYALRVTEHMRGKISAGGDVVALERVRADESVERAADTWVVPLTEHDRGKISIGHVTVLFQFVPPPPVQAVRPMEAMDFRPRLIEEDDPLFLGFLAVWSALGAVLLVWVITAEPPEITAQDVPDRFVRMVLPKEDKPPTEDPKLQDDDGLAQVSEKREESKAPKEPAPDAGEKKGPESKIDEARRKEKLQQEVASQSAFLQLIGTRGESSMQTSGFWSEADGSASDLDAVVSGVGGVKVADGTETGPRTGTGGSDEDVDIGSLSSAGGGTAGVAAGPAVQVQGSVDLGSANYADVEGADSVKQVVQANYGRLKYCYETRLKANPTLSGRVEIEWNVARGRVTSANVFANTTQDAEFAQCLVNKVRQWKFPDDVQGDMVFPFIFTPK